jgi:hypothetical protein
MHPFLVDHADANMNLAPYSPIRVKFMVNAVFTPDKAVKLLLPNPNVFGISDSTLLRCYIKWRAGNKLYRVEGTPSYTAGGSKDELHCVNNIPGSMQADQLYELVFEKRDADSTMDNLGFNFASFTSKLNIQMQIADEAVGGNTDIYPQTGKTRTVTVNDIKIFEKE